MAGSWVTLPVTRDPPDLHSTALFGHPSLGCSDSVLSLTCKWRPKTSLLGGLGEQPHPPRNPGLAFPDAPLCCSFHDDAPKDYRQVSLTAVKQRFEDKRYQEISQEEVPPSCPAPGRLVGAGVGSQPRPSP